MRKSNVKLKDKTGSRLISSVVKKDSLAALGVCNSPQGFYSMGNSLKMGKGLSGFTAK